MAGQREQAAQKVLIERRILVSITITLIIGLLLWIIAISTNYWAIIDGGKGAKIPNPPRIAEKFASGAKTADRIASGAKIADKISGGTKIADKIASGGAKIAEGAQKIADKITSGKTKISEILKTGNERYLLKSHSGIWKSCRTVFYNKTKKTVIEPCIAHNLFPAKILKDKTYLDYQRSVAAFSIISLFVLFMGLFFSIYTFKQTRYMFKRLAAFSHLVGGGCVLIVLELVSYQYHYASQKLPIRHPKGTTWHYGYSFILAWITFVIEVIAFLGFAVCSRKKKKDKAPDEQYAIEEEPTIIGR